MTTVANVLALVGIAAIRFGIRFGGSFLFMLFGLTVVGLVAWALTRPVEKNTPDRGGQTGGDSPAAGAQK